MLKQTIIFVCRETVSLEVFLIIFSLLITLKLEFLNCLKGKLAKDTYMEILIIMNNIHTFDWPVHHDYTCQLLAKVDSAIFIIVYTVIQ